MEDEKAASKKDQTMSSASSSEKRGARLSEQLSKVYHDLNNSLSVISGNAQLLSEMARAEALSPSFTEPLKDIEAARAEVSEVLERLDRLREETIREEE